MKGKRFISMSLTALMSVALLAGCSSSSPAGGNEPAPADEKVTATVTVCPEVELGEYMGGSAEKKNYKTKVADVDAEIDEEQG